MLLRATRNAVARRGFTLIEIMLVILLISILLTIAVPTFLRARETSRVRVCVANLRQLQDAKERWSMENKKAGTDTPSRADLSTYIKTWPSCPSGGTYDLGTVAGRATCSVGGEHTID